MIQHAEQPLSEQLDHFVLEKVSWNTYQHIWKALEGRHVFATYHKGRLELMVTSFMHESSKKLIARLLEQMSMELNIPMFGVGSVTCQNKDLELGFESDECYFVRNQPAGVTRLKRPLDLRCDAPPDLAIEVEITHRVIEREKIYAEAGVKELWRYDGENLRFFHLGRAGFRRRPRSKHFPFLRPENLEVFLRREGDQTQHEIVRAFQTWVRQNLAEFHED